MGSAWRANKETSEVSVINKLQTPENSSSDRQRDQSFVYTKRFGSRLEISTHLLWKNVFSRKNITTIVNLEKDVSSEKMGALFSCSILLEEEEIPHY